MYSEDLHILQNSSVNLLRCIPRNLLREIQSSFCWILLFLLYVKKKSTQNYAYPVLSRIVTEANELFFEGERERVIGNLFFPLFQSITIRNQPLLLAPRRLGRFSRGDVVYFWRNVPSGEEMGEKWLFSQAVNAEGAD